MAFWKKWFGGDKDEDATAEAPVEAPAPEPSAAPLPEVEDADPDAVDPQELYDAGMAAWTAGELDRAEDLLEEAAELAPDVLKYVGNLGNLLQERGDYQAALGCHERVIAINDGLAIAHFNRGNALVELGELAAAAGAYSRTLALDQTHAQAAASLGRSLWRIGEHTRAVDAWRKALTLETDDADVLRRLGAAMLLRDEDAEAVELLTRAAALEPDRPSTSHNLGKVLMRLSRPAEALVALARVLEVRPDDVEARYDHATALKHLGRIGEARAGYEAALSIDPDHGESCSNLGWMLLQAGEPEAALEAWARSARLRRRTLQPHELERVPRHRLRHDAEQIRYLRETVGISDDEGLWLGHAEGLIMMGHDPIDISAPDLAEVAQRMVHLEVSPRVETGALRADLDHDDVCSRYFERRPEVVVVDGLLSDDALVALQEHARRSTMWSRTYSGGYLGAFMGGGLANPLVLQIAEELRLRLGPIFGEHQLEQCWAFKYDSRLRGINIHADVAAVNVNFWITPDEACEDPETGGLVVWDVESPPDWPFGDYNENEPKIRAFLEESGAKAIRVPHRCNRAVVFNSTLFHETDDIKFQDHYLSRRVNMTMLFGLGLRQ